MKTWIGRESRFALQAKPLDDAKAYLDRLARLEALVEEA